MEAEIKRVCDEMAEFLIGKNRSYGNSVAEPMGVFAKRADTLLQIDVRIDDKLSRLKKGADYPGDDTIKDLVGYLILRMVVAEHVVSNEKQTISVTVPAQFPNDHFEAADVLNSAASKRRYMLADVLSSALPPGDIVIDPGVVTAAGQKGDWRPWGRVNAFPPGVLPHDRVTIVIVGEGTVAGSAVSAPWGRVTQWQFTWEPVERIPGDGGRIVETERGVIGPKCYFGGIVRPYTGVVVSTDAPKRSARMVDDRDWFGRRPPDGWKCANGYYWNLDAYHRRKTYSN